MSDTLAAPARFELEVHRSRFLVLAAPIDSLEALAVARRGATRGRARLRGD